MTLEHFIHTITVMMYEHTEACEVIKNKNNNSICITIMENPKPKCTHCPNEQVCAKWQSITCGTELCNPDT